MLNSVCLVGRLTRDPETSYTQTSICVAKFTVAVDQNVKSSENGERKADFIYCVAYRKSAEFASQYLKKGQLVSVEGRISTRNYTNGEGRKVYVTEVIVTSVQGLDRKGERAEQGDEGFVHQPCDPALDPWADE